MNPLSQSRSNKRDKNRRSKPQDYQNTPGFSVDRTQLHWILFLQYFITISLTNSPKKTRTLKQCHFSHDTRTSPQMQEQIYWRDIITKVLMHPCSVCYCNHFGKLPPDWYQHTPPPTSSLHLASLAQWSPTSQWFTTILLSTMEPLHPHGSTIFALSSCSTIRQ